MDKYNRLYNPNYGKDDEESDPYNIGDAVIKPSEEFLR